MAWTPPTTTAFLAGHEPTSSELVTQLTNNLKVIGDSWTAYTPVWTGATTNPVIGNGSITGAYQALGKHISFRIIIVAGSTTTFGSGAYSFTYPPFPPADASNPGNPGMTGHFYDSNLAKPYGCFLLGASSTTFRPLMASTDSFMSQLVPVAPAVNDELNFGGFYEAA